MHCARVGRTGIIGREGVPMDNSPWKECEPVIHSSDTGGVSIVSGSPPYSPFLWTDSTTVVVWRVPYCSSILQLRLDKSFLSNIF